MIKLFTQGPWRVIRQRHHVHKAWQWIIDSPSRGGMALSELHDLSSWAKRSENGGPHNIAEQAATFVEVSANMQLMAAAPKLVDALELLLAASDAINKCPDIPDSWRAARRIARKTLEDALKRPENEEVSP